ncbi:MAG TPA: translocation/assembly module TamB domain-containing protein, partial [Bacteroidales bacterium]|nr:translocation/assembly module TamB domain-containing protein [Bacteroidales bacterium]
SEGFISSQAQVSNTLSDPDISGGFQMQGGQIDIEDLGVVYNDIGLDGSFSGERISLGSLKIYSGDGSLEASGNAEIALLTDQKLKNIRVQINASEFTALDGEKGSAVINSKLSLSGPYNGAKVDGQLTIIQSTINTDALMAEQGLKTANPNPPLLVKAMEDTVLSNSLTTEQPVNAQRQNNTIFYDNMSGSFTVLVPGNTWVKGKDMNFELRGELRAVKEGPQIDLFGNLNVNRGYYKFYGKRFSFNRGSVTFTGGSDINPKVDFEVVYSFRDEERELRNLKLFLTGRALNPDIRFTLDDRFVEEKDAIAYILFGRRMDNLTAQQSTSVEQSAINLSRDIALGQVSNLLKDALQSTLQLDVVEISGGENWHSGSVTIGKYITNDLYVRYEQNFAFDKKNKVIEPEEIALEYQIIRSLFLQATNQHENSGFDLIYKKTWK